MIRYERIADLQAASRAWRDAGKRIGFVPTMGALHAGHLSLARRSKAEGLVTVVSIFVNPLQFRPSEDLTRYPRDLEGDSKLLKEVETDALFTTTSAEMYPPGFDTYVEPGTIAQPLCGTSRPGHFRGVATVVAKLFHLVSPHVAFFGQKDYQQARMLQRMVADLGFDLALRILPTVRDPDGLALSSRNRYLTPELRREAPELQRALVAVRDAFDGGERSTERLAGVGRAYLARSPGFRLDYLEVRDDDTLAPRETLDRGGVVAAAAFLGTTRLIDNLLLGAAVQRLG